MNRALKMPILAFLLAAGPAACGGASCPSPKTAPPAVQVLSTLPAPRGELEARGDLREALALLGRIHFATDSYQLTPGAQSRLAEAAETLRLHPDVFVYVSGYADERGTSRYNDGLGLRRAHAIVGHLMNHGVRPDRVAVVSFGERRPLLAGHEPDVWAQNRRVEIRLMRSGRQLVAEPPRA